METIAEIVSPETGKQQYYWAYAIYQGRVVIDGWYNSYDEACNFGYQKLPVQFEVIGLPTKDRAKATQVIKHKVLEQTRDLNQALKRARHTK